MYICVYFCMWVCVCVCVPTQSYASSWKIKEDNEKKSAERVDFNLFYLDHPISSLTNISDLLVLFLRESAKNVFLAFPLSSLLSNMDNFYLRFILFPLSTICLFNPYNLQSLRVQSSSILLSLSPNLIYTNCSFEI